MPIGRRKSDSPEEKPGGGWFRRSSKPAAVTAWDLMYRLRSAEEAMQMPPSRAEVQAMVLAYETTATRLEAMGEGAPALWSGRARCALGAAAACARTPARS